MIKSKDFLDIIEIILDKEKIDEQDLNNVKNLTLNKYEIGGKETDIDLNELRFLKNLKTLILNKFSIDKNIISYINDNKNLEAIQFTNCKFEDIIQINKEINYVVFDYCENVKLEFFNNNKTIKMIGSKIDLKQLKQFEDIEELYFQNCEIQNIEEILKYQKLKLINLDGSSFENKNVLTKIPKNVKVKYKEEYCPV